METVRKNRKKLAIIISGALLLLAIALALYLLHALDYRNAFARQPESGLPAVGSAAGDLQAALGSANVVYILFLGIDRIYERDTWLDTFRSDTIALARLDFDNKNIRVLNIPRDTYTYIPVENKMDKIGHAYVYGNIHDEGVPASIAAVNYFLQRQAADYFVAMNLDPIPKIVDEIGGVQIDVEIEMKDHNANLDKGLQVLNGSQAFDYIHWRYSSGGDIDRIIRQQKFLRALANQQRDAGKILETVQIILKYKDDLKTSLDTGQLIALAKFMSELPEGSVSYQTIPGQGEMIDGISYWIPDKDKTAEMISEFMQS
ncbi:MAG TPA: LCP family protein [Desulfitobacteriaceae bacterium]|nr:LCP family protein [Desulfitobacteriaceae bacterium]